MENSVLKKTVKSLSSGKHLLSLTHNVSNRVSRGVEVDIATMQTVGDAIRAIRLGQGLEQKDLATDGIPVQVIDLIEKNLCWPPQEWLNHFAQVFGLPVFSSQTSNQSMYHAAQLLCDEGLKCNERGDQPNAADMLMKAYDMIMAYQFYDLLPQSVPTLLQVLSLSGRGEDAVRVGMHAVTCMPQGFCQARRDVLIRTGAAMMGINDFARAIDLFDEVLNEPTTDSVTAIKMLLNSGTCYMNMGEFEQARHLYGQALEIADELQEPFWLAWTYINLAAVELEQYQAVPAILPYLDRAEQLAIEMDNVAVYAAAVHDRGAYYLYAGKLGLAQRLIENAVEYLGEESASAAYILDDLAHVYILRGFWRKADETIARMMKIADEIHAVRVRALAHRRQMQKSARMGKHDDAEKYFLQAMDGFLQAHHAFDARRTLELWQKLQRPCAAFGE